MRRLATALIALTLVTAACGGDTTAGDRQLVTSDLTRAASNAPTDDVARAEQDFGAALYAALVEGDENLVVSPMSIHVALAMALAGARGDTASQMAEALGVADIDPERLHASLNALDSLLESRNRVDPPVDGEEQKVELSIANALWGQSGFGFEESLLDLLAVNYGAGMRVVDFATATETARRAINDWVADNTNDRIEELIPQGALNSLTRLVLTNAVYLDATWADPFKEDATADRPFFLRDGTEVTVPTMRGQIGARYAAGDGWQAVDLAYTAGELSLLVIVPDIDRFAEVEGRLAAGLLDQVRAELRATEVQLELPKFEIRTQADLAAALAAMGIADAFDPGRADFTGISVEEQLYISGVLHEAFITVDEAGTEAAAATAVVVGATSAPIDVVSLDVDSPFLFALQDRETGTVLFLGRVLDPR